MIYYMDAFLRLMRELFTVDIFLYLLAAFALFAVLCLIKKAIYG